MAINEQETDEYADSHGAGEAGAAKTDCRDTNERAWHTQQNWRRKEERTMNERTPQIVSTNSPDFASS